MDKQVSEEIGFYYVVMQKTLSGQYINCWIDGSDTPEYYTYDELVELAMKSSNPDKVLSGLNKVMSEASLFVWDVDNDAVSRVSASSSSYNLASDLQDSFNREMINKQSNNSLSFTNVNFTNGRITLKI